jgi:hypothetical protein
MPAPSFLLDLRLSELGDGGCASDCCGRTVFIPFRQLALRRPAWVTC